MSHLRPDQPASLVLLGVEGLRAGSTPLWNRIASLAPDALRDVVCLPTALAGQKIGTADRRARLAASHLTKLGGNTRTVAILNREHAARHDYLKLLQSASAFYLLGGGPRTLATILMGTPAWDTIQQCQADGVLLVASGGAAAALGTIGIAPCHPYPAAQTDLSFESFTGLGLLPNIVVIPYLSWLLDPIIEQISSVDSPAMRYLGLDDQAALIWDGSQWYADGLGCITFWEAGGPRRIVDAGQPVSVDLLPPYRMASHYG